VKFQCTRSLLVEALQAVGGIVPTRGIKEVFESVRIDATAEGLQILGTDLEVSMRYTVPAGDGLQLQEEGALVAPARRLSAILQELPDGPVTLEAKQGTCHVKSSAGNYRITGSDPSDFPAIEIPEAADGIDVERAVFRELVQRTSFAAAREKMRYALNGILLLAKGEELQGVATDGRRMSHFIASCVGGGKDESRAIVPTRALTHLAKILKDEDETVRLTFAENHMAAATGRAVILARLVEGTFPNFDEVIPVNCERRATLEREPLVAALRRTAVLFQAREGAAGNSVRLRFEEGANLEMTASVADVGEAKVSVACSYEGAPEEVGYNATFLLDALNVSDADEVTFEFNSRQSPGRLADGDRFTYVVMPVTLD
jgi:DNA polymerase-3 subunit beta